MHEFFSENLRNPAHNRRAGLMRQFSSGQLYSMKIQLILGTQVPSTSRARMRAVAPECAIKAVTLV